jgi:cytochrome c oxidase cbb3-type subunit 4
MDAVTFLRMLFTVLIPILFIGIVIWAYSKKRKKAFDEAANLPFADEDRTRHDNTLRETHEGDPE